MNERVVLAYLEDKPIGTIRFSIDLKDSQIGHINRLAVLPSCRGKEYGEQLMNFAEVNLIELGVKLIKIDIVAEFKKLQEYYERLGYSEVIKEGFQTLPFEVLFLRKNI
jgi:ribosomal protein S18 acetylase RimI-like enzyme